MPRQTRWAIKQKMKTVLKELNTAQNKLVELGQIYKENYPDYYKELCLFVEYFEKLKQGLEEFSNRV